MRFCSSLGAGRARAYSAVHGGRHTPSLWAPAHAAQTFPTAKACVTLRPTSTCGQEWGCASGAADFLHGSIFVLARCCGEHHSGHFEVLSSRMFLVTPRGVQCCLTAVGRLRNGRKGSEWQSKVLNPILSHPQSAFSLSSGGLLNFFRRWRRMTPLDVEAGRLRSRAEGRRCGEAGLTTVLSTNAGREAQRRGAVTAGPRATVRKMSPREAEGAASSTNPRR